MQLSLVNGIKTDGMTPAPISLQPFAGTSMRSLTLTNRIDVQVDPVPLF